MKETFINLKYPVVLPDFRYDFHLARPLWEAGRLESMAQRVEEGMIVYDVGAEHGDFTALYRTWVGKTGDVIPIEPSPHYWPFIRETMEANGFDAPPSLSFPGFAGDISKPRLSVHRHEWPQAAFGEGIPDGGFRHLAQDVATSRIKIDDLAEEVRPDVLTIDVEGAEFHVLLGAMRTLAEKPMLVWVSTHDVPLAEWYQHSVSDIYELMATLGYVGTHLPHHGEGEHFHFFEAT